MPRPVAILAVLVAGGRRLRTWYRGEQPLSDMAVRRAIAGAVAVGVALRLALMLCSHGSNDMGTWARFADAILQDGIWQLYRDQELFNHPPLMGWMAAGLRSLSASTGIPYPVLFKTPCLLGDIGIMMVLAKVWRRTSHVAAAVAVLVFALNPVSITVTAFHGNTDSLVAAFGLFAGYAVSRQRYGWAGLLVAVAANVKIVGLLWAPGLFLLCPDRRAMVRFVAGGAAGMTPFVLPLLEIPEEFHRNVLAYGSRPRNWGIHRLLAHGRGPLAEPLAAVSERFMAWGRILVVGGVLAWAGFGRLVRLDPFRATAMTMAVFLTLAPGFAVQYLVWIVPVLAAADQRFNLRYAVLGGLFAVSIYVTWLTDAWPLASRHKGIPAPSWLVGLFVWATLIELQWSTAWRAIGSRGAESLDAGGDDNTRDARAPPPQSYG